MSISNLLEGDQAIKPLTGAVSCPVFQPGDAGYTQEIAGFNTAIVHSPDLVVGAESVDDVVAAIRFARERGLQVTIQATGHGAYKPITSGLLICTRRLDRIEIDSESATATIGGGATWAPVIAATAPYGLAPITGSSQTVGVVGLLLGGGLGPMARSHGFAADYLLSMTVVTGEGEVVVASRESNADLFWALRGGKTGLGVVVEVTIRLVRVESLYAGSLFFAEEDIEAAFRAWIDWTATADPRVTTSAAILRFPPFEFIPAPLRGRRLLNLRFAYPGDCEVGARLAAPLRDSAPVYIDALGEMPLADVAKIHNDPPNPGPSWIHGALFTHVDQEMATEFLGHFGKGTDAPFLLAEIRHIGEASARDTVDGSAVGGRGGRYTMALACLIPELFGTVLPPLTDGIRESLRRWISEENNINFVGEHRAEELIASAWPTETAARLAKVRLKYDPDKVFSL